MRLPLLIDTDPAMGTLASDPEDCFAITYALNSPEAEVVGITCVAGNVPVTHSFANARHLLELLDRSDVPLAAGAHLPLDPARRPLQVAWQRDGEQRTRLLPRQEPPFPGRPATELISSVARDAGGELIVVAIGPLTNIASALVADPGLAPLVKELWVMGGAFDVSGNHTPFAEFNVWADPEAASVVVDAGLDVTYVGLDVCNRTHLTRDDINSSRISTDLGSFVLESCATWFGDIDTQEGGLHLYDSLTVASCLDRGLVTTIPSWVSVETGTGPAQGATGAWRADLHGPWLKPAGEPNAKVAVDLDSNAFHRLFAQRVLSLL